MTSLEISSCNCFFVYVCHEIETPSSREIANIFGIGSDDRLKVIVINTRKSLTIGDRIVSPIATNRFFEFSGYELGLKKILYEHEFEDGRVIFVNSTVVGKQSFSSLYFRLLSVAIANEQCTASVNRISGLVRARPSYNYIPTCFFEVTGSRKALSELVFVPSWLKKKFSAVDQEDFGDLALYVGDKEEYLSRQEEWLNPNSLFRGWYQAPFFKPLDKDVYRRKQITIFLEHSLLANNPSFEVVDLRAADSWLTLFEWGNRAKIIAWKVANRLGYLIRRNG
jgi:hypothetical protein